MVNVSDLSTIIRPANSIMVGFAVIVGVAVSAPSIVFSLPTLLGFLTGFLISSYSMVINDYYDVEVDKVNAPERPLASGKLKGQTAVQLGLILLALGVVSSIPLGPVNLAIAAFFAFLAWLYNFWGKKKGLAGNFIVAASVAVPYVYGAAAIGEATNLLVWVLALVSFVAGTGREVVKTISDVPGDEVRRIRSVARTYGANRAALIGASLFMTAVGMSVLPILLGIAGIVYGILVLIPDGIFIFASLRILGDYSTENALRIKKLALIGMMTGLLAFIVGGVFR